MTIGLINLIGGLLLGLVCIIGTFVRLDGNENVDKGVLLRQGILFIICAVIGRLFLSYLIFVTDTKKIAGCKFLQI